MREIDYDTEDYLALVKQYKTQAKYKKFIWERNLPPISRIIKEFGSWSAAKNLVEYEEPQGSSTSTFLYLVYFYDEGFFKVGITKEGVYKRLLGYPDYQVIDKILMGWNEAVDAEAFIVNKVTNPYRPYSVKFKSGHTECFKSGETQNLNKLLKGSNMAWSIEEEKELTDLHAEGLLVKEIAVKLNRPLGTVANKCTRLGLSNKTRWTEKDEQELIKLSNEGHSTERIALRLNRTMGAIQQKISRLLRKIP